MRKQLKIICFVVLFLIVSALGVGIVFVARYPVKYKTYIKMYANQDIPAELILGVIKAESSFNEKAQSSAGALGLMQVKPSTAEYVAKIYNLPPIDYEKQLFDAKTNIQIGTLYLNYLYSRFNGNLKHVLVAYNAGETKTAAWLNAENFEEVAYKESLNYAKKVEQYTKIYKKLL